MLNPSILLMLPQIKQDPLGFLLRNNINIPANVATDPSSIMNYLLSSGRITQSQVNYAYNAMKNQNGGA